MLWISGIAAFALVWMSQLDIAAEPVHLVEYGVFGILAFRALSHHLRDRAVYLAAAALTALIGTLDELFQWLTPGRLWDLGDIGLNVATGVLMQLLIWQGFRPAAVAGRPQPRSLRVAWRFLCDPDEEVAEPWSSTWLPLFSNGAGDYLVLETKGIQAGSLIAYLHDESYRSSRFSKRSRSPQSRCAAGWHRFNVFSVNSIALEKHRAP